jgi:hypothetical protein
MCIIAAMGGELDRWAAQHVLLIKVTQMVALNGTLENVRPSQAS